MKQAVALNRRPNTWLYFKQRDNRWYFWSNEFRFNDTNLNDIIFFYNIDLFERINRN
jgi:hypothetical protein